MDIFISHVIRQVIHKLLTSAKASINFHVKVLPTKMQLIETKIFVEDDFSTTKHFWFFVLNRIALLMRRSSEAPRKKNILFLKV